MRKKKRTSIRKDLVTLYTIIHENFKCMLSKKINASVEVTQIIVTQPLFHR